MALMRQHTDSLVNIYGSLANLKLFFFSLNELHTRQCECSLLQQIVPTNWLISIMKFTISHFTEMNKCTRKFLDDKNPLQPC